MGYWHGGDPTYGYKLSKSANGNKLAINNEEAKWVKHIFTEYSKGKSSLSIQDTLLKNRVKARRGGSFSLGSIQAILKNSHYKGSYDYTDSVSEETVTVKCPKIINGSLFLRVSDMINVNKQRRNTTNRTTRFSLLRDFMYCGHCGNAMGQRVVLKQGTQVYYCPRKNTKWEWDRRNNNKDRTVHCTNTRTMNIKKTNEIVWNIVKKVAMKSNVLKERVKTESLANKSETDEGIKTKLESQIKQETACIKQIELIDNGIATIDEERVLKLITKKESEKVKDNLLKRKDTEQKRLVKIQKAKKELQTRDNWIDWVSRFKKTYSEVDNLNDSDKKKYLSGIISKITVKYDAKTTNHKLNIDFHFPIVEDKYEVIGKEENRRKYQIIEGKKVLKIDDNFNLKKVRVSKGLMKKKPFTYSHIKSVTVE